MFDCDATQRLLRSEQRVRLALDGPDREPGVPWGRRWVPRPRCCALLVAFRRAIEYSRIALRDRTQCRHSAESGASVMRIHPASGVVCALALSPLVAGCAADLPDNCTTRLTNCGMDDAGAEASHVDASHVDASTDMGTTPVSDGGTEAGC